MGLGRLEMLCDLSSVLVAHVCLVCKNLLVAHCDLHLSACMLGINRVYLKIFMGSCNVQTGLDSGEASKSMEREASPSWNEVFGILVNAMDSLGALR